MEEAAGLEPARTGFANQSVDRSGNAIFFGTTSGHFPGVYQKRPPRSGYVLNAETGEVRTSLRFPRCVGLTWHFATRDDLQRITRDSNNIFCRCEILECRCTCIHWEETCVPYSARLCTCISMNTRRAS